MGEEILDVQWVKIRSWHVFLTFTRAINGARTVCNRNAKADTLTDVRPEGEKTCEVCLRKVAK